MADDWTTEDAYDELAESYREDAEEDAYNAHLEFPCTTELIPDVDGLRVLDVGCGGGRYTEWLLDHGAEVVGVDASEGMLTEARERVGDRATLHRGNIDSSLDFARDDAFDGVVCSLVLDYVEDWRAPLREFARVLDDGGFLVLSARHPFDEFPIADDENYFTVERRIADWAVEVPYYRRPLTEMLTPLLETGFRLDAVREPEPTAAFARQRPDAYEKESRQPVFLCLRAVRP